MECEDNSVDFAVEIDNSLETKWQHLTDMPRSPRPPLSQLQLSIQASQQDNNVLMNQQSDPTYISPPSSPLSPFLTRKADHSAQFRYEFQSLIQNNKHAKRKWTQFQKKYKTYCTNKRCIKLLLTFCARYGLEFEALSKQHTFKKLGSRSNCHCSLSSPLVPGPLPPLTPVTPLSPLGPMSPLSTMSPLSPMGPLSPMSISSPLCSPISTNTPLNSPFSPVSPLGSPLNTPLNNPFLPLASRVPLITTSTETVPFEIPFQHDQFQSQTSRAMWNSNPVNPSPIYMSYPTSSPVPQPTPSVPAMIYTRPRAGTYPCYPMNLAYVPHPTPTLPHLILPSTH